MCKRGNISVKYLLAAFVFAVLFIITFRIEAKDKLPNLFFKSLTATPDTILPDSNNKKINFFAHSDTLPKSIKDTLIKNADTSIQNIDTTKIGDTLRQTIDTLELSKDSLDAPVNYSAEDSGVLIISSKQFFLYGKANTKHQDMELEAGTIKYDQQTQLVTAYGGIDTATNDPLNKPKLTQGGTESIQDTIYFNMKTQRGITKNTYYKEGEIFVHAEKVKKVDKDVAYAFRGRFTTCNLDTPHFDFRTKKLKLINNKIAVSGPAYPEFEGVPIPIAIPFGIYPLYRGRHSGVLVPSLASNESLGLGLEGLGYYKVLNDYWDVTIRTNIYSYGGWNLDIRPDYFKRYKYRGTFDLAIQRTKILNTVGLSKDEFTTSKNFQINWNHSTDTRARPGTSFTASVRAGTTQYNQLYPSDALRNYQNMLSSSITYSKTWAQGKYNLSVAANHDQNSNLRLINVRMPTVNFNATTIYPLQKKEQAGTPKWYQKLGVSYTGTLLNQFSFYDSAVNFRRLLDTAQWGADHRIPITLSLPPLGPFIFGPSVSYAERWYGQLIERTWNPANHKVDTTVHRGFFTAREMSFGVSMNTRIFGTLNFKKTSNIVAIRHEIKPFISASYKPDLVKKYFKDVQISDSGDVYRFSELDGGVMGTFSEGRFGGLSFGIDNLLEMKVRNKKDTTGEEPTKKIRLIDGLGITGGYNFFADSLNWSPISMNFRSTLFEKVNITGSAGLDLYKIDTLGRRINKLLWKEGKPGRITNGSLAISTSLQSKAKDERKDADRIPLDETLTPDEQQRQLDYVRQNPAEFVDFNIPWNLQLSYSLNFYRTLSSDLRSFQTTVNSSININGDFSITPKWKIGGGTYFDFRTAKIQTVSMFLTREMHCWQMAINIQVGQFKSFSIVLNPKSGILRDLKVNRTRSFSSYY